MGPDKTLCEVIDLNAIWDDLKAFHEAESFRDYVREPVRLSRPIARISTKTVYCSYMETGMETSFN